MLFVAGLASDFDDVDLKEMFELYGEVSSAKLITDRNTGKSKGFGFVEMPNEAEAKETITTLDGVMLQRKKISVKEAEAQQPRTGGGGYGGGSYNSGGFNNSRSYNSNSSGYGNSGGSGGQRPRKPYTPGGGSGGGYNRDRDNSGGYNRDRNSGGGGYNRDRDNGGGYNSGGYNRDRNNDNRGNRSDDDFNKRY